MAEELMLAEFDVDAGKLAVSGDGETTAFMIDMTDAPQKIPLNAEFVANAPGFKITTKWDGTSVTFFFDSAPPANQLTTVAVHFRYQGI